MSRKNVKSKKSTSKYRKFNISPLIPAIAIIEVLILIGVSTFSWFNLSANKQLNSGIISVDTDSGLDIDFQYADAKHDYINIWDYVDKNFEFEPVTSLDGRNVFVPTSGTYEETTTEDMIFREGTINDINSKYINIDFELTNTSEYMMDIYLNNNSFFRVKDDQDHVEESRALRLAFYTNDGNFGNVGSSMIARADSASDGGDSSTVQDKDPNSFTIYFDNSDTKWSTVYAHFWDDATGTANDIPYTAWPGVEMSRVSGSAYMCTIKNPAEGTNGVKYDKVIFSNNGSSKTNAVSLTQASNNQIFKKNSSNNCTSSAYTTHTVYFMKPTTWNKDYDNDGVADLYCTAYSGSYGYTPGTGDKMDYVGGGIYSYTYNSTMTGGVLFNNLQEWNNNALQTQDIPIADFGGSLDNKIFYWNGTKSSNKLVATTLKKDGSDYHFNAVGDDDPLKFSYKAVYFYNTYNWDKPYLMATSSTDSNYSVDIPLTSLSGNVYYCTVPEYYDTVYFHQKGSALSTTRTVTVTPQSGYVYRPTDQASQQTGYWRLREFLYADYTQETGYPVISPGVSVGFQRPYSPVVNINSSSGAPTEIIPAFANSIDDYIYSGTGKKIFSIPSKSMVSLSMVLWLEGTDLATYGTTYPGNNIELRLEFATVTHTDPDHPENWLVNNQGDTDNYTFRFYDKTRELWTSDRKATESGVTVAPVMQLYDCTIGRGYLMEPYSYGSYNGKKKVDCWTVDAPPSIATLGHEIEFRRVNPYDESEVWNYWHPGRVAGGDSDQVYRNKADLPIGNTGYSVYTQALDSDSNGTNVRIAFSAFADGSPLDSMLTANDGSYTAGSAHVPTYSCGGLWGNHSTRTLTVLDGTKDQWIHNNKGILNMNYSYTYSGSGAGNSRTVNIEYKSSVFEDTMYYFIVPELIYKENSNTAIVSDIAFKRYYNFEDSYAINSDRNNKLKFDTIFDTGGGVAKGQFFEIGETVTHADNQTRGLNNYWGSDILYIQTTNTTCVHMYTSLSDHKILRARFTNSGNSNSFYAQLFPNSHFKAAGEDNGYGYPVVIPNNHEYNQYRVDLIKTDSGNEAFFYTAKNSLYASTVTSSTSTLEITNAAYGSGQSWNICKLKNFKDIVIYFESNNSTFNGSGKDNFQGNNNGRRIQFFGIRGVSDMEYPGYELTWMYNTGYDNYQRYYVTINPNNYGKFEVNNWNWGNNEVKYPKTGFSPANNGDVYQGYEDNGKKIHIVSNISVTGYSDNKEVLNNENVSADSTNWPHYSSQ